MVLSNVVYIGHLPHGFYERELQSYFGQFGEITHLRVSRNKSTGKSKHYCFIEFKEQSVANIVAKTHDGYILFENILVCRVLDQEAVHPSIWKGADRDGIKNIHTSIRHRKKVNKPKTQEQWQKNAIKVLKQRKVRRAKMLHLFEAAATELNHEYDNESDGDEIELIPISKPKSHRKQKETKTTQKSEKSKKSNNSKVQPKKSQSDPHSKPKPTKPIAFVDVEDDDSDETPKQTKIDS